MKKVYIISFMLLCLCFSNCAKNKSTSKSLALEEGFKNPPNEAKARTWWHWISGNVSKSGITKDLEAMKAVGIQEAQLFNVHLGFPKGPIKYLSEEWLDLFKFSAEEAKRLGLELAFHNSPGWSSSGGPWVTEENAMQTVVYSELEVAGGNTIKELLPKPKTKFEYYQDIAILAFPKPKEFKKIDGLDYKILSERIRNHLLPDTTSISNASIILKESVLDITSKVSKDGLLEWNAPKGEWIILRFGHTPIGTTNRPAPPEAKGLEVDKMSKSAVDAYWKGGVQPIIDKLGNLIGTTVNNCLIDSYEVETTNWTSGFETQFKNLRGYDLISYLPTLAGYYVESGEISECFLWDYRRTIGDLIAENYYEHFADLCHKNGMQFSVEPYWGPFDNMQVGATGDIVMCEFWSGGYPFFDSAKFVSSIAHLNGSSIVGAESFTGIGGWDKHPADLKSIGDRAWTEGITRFIFHTYVHQPWDVAPGLALSYHGFDFNRLNTWWSQSKAYMDYLARSQYLLQQGKNVADVLVFTGESSPNIGFIKSQIKEMGFDYDLIGANKLKDLSVKDGIIYSSVGNTYTVLVLPESDYIKPETLEKVIELVEGGAMVIGKKPKQSPSLTNYPESDVYIKKTANALWDSTIIQNISIEDFLEKNSIAPDFFANVSKNADISFIHRKTQDADIYFVANARKESVSFNANFRVANKQPELWNTQTGDITKLAVWQDKENGTTSIPITLDSEQSVFIIFRETTENQNHIVKTTESLKIPKAESLSNLKIIKAEYGNFLQEGLIDVTDKVSKEVIDGKLVFQMTRAFCDCDPAMGYVKEFRMVYQIGDEVKDIHAEEREFVTIDAEGKELKIISAVFGKFKSETMGVPKNFQAYDVTENIRKQVALERYTVKISDDLVDGKTLKNEDNLLKITFETDGNTRTEIISEGEHLNLKIAFPNSEIYKKDGNTVWKTPFSGTLSYQTKLGNSKSIKVKVPQPVNLSENWEVTFPLRNGISKNKTYQTLSSWSEDSDEEIQHFSGTAVYKKTVNLSKKQLSKENSLELDLGSVGIISEVIINNKKVATLWKAPFRVAIDDFVEEGENTIQIKVTNLWVNRLIGDEKLPLDYERKGEKITALPNWLHHPYARPSNRQTFASWKHWSEDSELLTSGLLGPVKINVFLIKELK
ncbi:glycosyl hydrolase [Maribacter sp. R86514]|uniref:glycosyl hydrolase n=1 Tax=Maribacter sp. R86514 TaxID=3093854 RepID=UPI0037C5B01A